MSEQVPSPEVPQQAYGTPAGQEPPAAPAEPAPKKRGGGIVRVVIILVVLAIIAGAGWYLSKDDAVNANVNDCLAGTTAAELNADKLKIVKCDDASAGFKVVQKVESKKYEESDAACTEPSTEFVFWSGKDGKAGTVLCLVSVKK